MKRGWFYDIGNVNKEKKRQNNTILRDPQDILLYEDLISLILVHCILLSVQKI